MQGVGSAYLRQCGVCDKTCALVNNHVKTKRYLTAINKDYYDKLSPASKGSLRYQGGPMTPNECRDYEADELFTLHLKIREWDDKAKDDSPEMLEKIKKMNPIDYYYTLYLKYA